MEVEEHEQIPWSHLVAEVEPQVDRRIYLVGGAVASVVLLIVAMRFFGSTAAAPVPQEVAAAMPAPTGTEQVATATVPVVVTTVGAISEADLMADVPAGNPASIDTARLVAEWFVTDFFTRDGSTATLASLEERLRSQASEALPHGNDMEPNQFVEWAKVFSLVPTAVGQEASVAYRAVRATNDGFVRDPVRAVAVSLFHDGERWLVDSLPTSIETP